MKQKICIIAALIHEPKLWVLDEPMMGLDPQSTAEIIAHMREHCAKGNTVFFSSHNLDLVKKLCHRVAIVNEGRLIDLFDLAGNEENKANLEERFFRITGTYEDRLFEDYIAQESADMRPDSPVAKTENEGKADTDCLKEENSNSQSDESTDKSLKEDGSNSQSSEAAEVADSVAENKADEMTDSTKEDDSNSKRDEVPEAAEVSATKKKGYNKYIDAKKKGGRR